MTEETNGHDLKKLPIGVDFCWTFGFLKKNRTILRNPIDYFL